MADFGDFTSGIDTVHGAPASSTSATDASANALFMDDFLGGASSSDPAADPTADFLAREQAILGADAAALFGNTAVSATSPTAFSSFQTAAATASTTTVGSTASASSGLDFELLSAGSVAAPGSLAPFASASATKASSVSPPSSAFGIFDQPQQHVLAEVSDTINFDESAFPEVSNIGETTGSLFSSHTGTLAMESSSAVSNVEPEPIREWRERFNAEVAERDARSKSKHDQILQQAKANLERLYAEYTEKKTKSIARNKELEKTLLAAREDSVSGSIWDRAVKQIDVSQAASKDKKLDDKKERKALATGTSTSKPKCPDTTRFKQLLISLRNDKNAPVV
ncbi:hypothetical protein BASA50_000959 [Batrachochytrium salamandrivorans]|uniref:Clathrin light chain n=1 Tax=Batrachochytrium salamandrivorans TaxID=1357716 RepID=A0ABQ8ETU0_9FUNG|nr:hypothetical protein BASA62_006961 [Batrachochytrium salamandrivorans]KAH6582245.1 hypothetical protein BASA60_002007 [Batrachochytrium salamandrivorans]KAH6586016.1 hypothetical protein BASA50_000959 [Batrachochytrium salamandrivorans]KAH6587415.1 hypothetical protein BASA61_006305 [Batrachochytrium salamandrivorans]KAH9275696.1 hypothetical protein BASA83_001996 [Batrachochytrium salamandrivorans]